MGLFFLSCLPLVVFAGIHSAAFFYGTHLPLDQLRAYDAVVVTPNANINPLTNGMQSQLIAYVSVGEVAESASYYQQIPTRWLIGENKNWKSKIIDQTQVEWRNFFIKQLITPLWNKGYRGFFLDTLDSYQLAVKDPAQQQQQIQGLVQLIEAIKKKYPDAKIILNRGFELIPQLRIPIDAVVAESLYRGWNQAKKSYFSTTQEDQTYLLTELNKIKEKNIPIIIIDYLPPAAHQQAQALAKKIMQAGMIPWIADPKLETIGVGSLQPIQRKIFIIYSIDKDSTIFNPEAFMLLTLPLEYLGYLVEFHNCIDPLPTFFSATDYVGIVVWADMSNKAAEIKLHQWLVDRMHQHVPIVFMASFGFDATNKFLQPFGITTKPESPNSKGSLHIVQEDKEIIGFEVKPYLNRMDFTPYSAENSEILFKLVDGKGNQGDMVAITPWGGYAISPYVLLNLPNNDSLWIINPFKFITKALRLKPFPIPDVTTENGRRLMFVHIDGDGFMTPAKWPGGKIAALELKNKILNVYKIPTTVSVVTGEIAPNGLYPNYSAGFEKIAQELFAFDWVEVASHTFSHPFDWIMVERFPKSGKYNLPIPIYRYDPVTEIKGSSQYINQHLTTAIKPCKILLWSGYGNPTAKDVAITYQNNLLNLNGGDTNVTLDSPSITRIGPYGLKKGDHYQIFNPISNEEFYTNSWSAPLYGFERVIETFQLTDQPYRFKPIDIYYHFYSASTRASLDALNKVYQWALKQPVMPIYASDYIRKVMDFYDTSIARVGRGWQIRTNGNLREIRMPLAMGVPDLVESQNIIGYQVVNDHYYIHLGPDPLSTLYFSNLPTLIPYLIEANGKIITFKRQGKNFTFQLSGNLPLQFQLGSMQGCRLITDQKIEATAGKNNSMIYHMEARNSHELRIECE